MEFHLRFCEILKKIVLMISSSDTMEFAIGNKIIGAGKPSLIIGEVALVHDGSLGAAHAFIDAIASTGADVVKFQTHIPEAESTPSEQFRVKFSYQDASRYEYWKRTSFSSNQWKDLATHAEKVGLIFLSSPFSTEAVNLLEKIGMVAWKIPSGEVSNLDLLERVTHTGKPVLLSSGLSDWNELDTAVNLLSSNNSQFVVLQCNSEYPCPPEKVGINLLHEIRNRYHYPVGLSDHSGTIFPSIAAAMLGASVIEVHIVFNREMFGPDVSSSVTTEELREIVKGVRFIERMLSQSIDKNSEAKRKSTLKRIFSKSVVARIDIPAGTLLKKEHLCIKKPGTGIKPIYLDKILGKKTKRLLHKDDLIQFKDIK